LDFRTAIDNVMLQAEIRRLPRGPIEARAKELFEQLRLTAAMKKYPRQLSGGMRQRVSLVRELEIRRLPRGPIEARAKELFEQLRLTAAMKKYPRQLSGGMRQRVSLVRAL